jgi:cystathionine beta-synthase
MYSISDFKTYKETGKIIETTPYLVEGIGQEIVPANVHIKYVDEVINVTDGESFEMSRMLGRLEGIFCGGSTGTNLAAALRVASNLDENAIVVFIVCDTGEHYLSKHHSDEWLKEKRLLEPQKITAGLISGTKKPQAPKTLVSMTPGNTVAEALEKMDDLGVTQMPVLEEGRAVGSLRENRVLAKVVRNHDLLNSQVSEVMEASFPTVDVDASSSEVARRLQTSAAVLVEEYGRIIGIITRHDVLDLKNVGQ